MEPKTLNDFSEFVRINGAVESLRLERLEVSTRIQEIDTSSCRNQNKRKSMANKHGR